MKIDRDRQHLLLIVKLIALIRTSLEGLDRQAFMSSPVHMDATAFRIQHIGEAGHHLSPALKRRHPGIRWSDIIGMRNFLAHNYEDVRPARVWATVVDDLDAVEAMCRAELGE